MKIIALSDTHTEHEKVSLPDGDILIFAGDFEIRRDRPTDLFDMIAWFSQQPHKTKIVIFGNHDFTNNLTWWELQQRFGKIYYLDNGYIIVNGLKIWGSSYSPTFMDWAWMKSDNELKEIYATIPDDTDIVVTHTPCRGILDDCGRYGNVGSISLRERIKEIKPKIHICGHIHNCHGKYTDGQTDYYNVSAMDDNYDVINRAMIIEV